MNVTRGDIVEHVRGLEGKTLILAHPASGTTWLCDQFEAAGLVAAHEIVKPHLRDRYDVVVTYKHWGAMHRRYDHVLALAREPLANVRSAAALLDERKQFRYRITSDILGDGCSHAGWAMLGGRSNTAVAALTYAGFHRRVIDLRIPTFRIEDAVGVTEEARQNSHRPKASTDEVADRLMKEDPLLLQDLAVLAAWYGYE